MVPSLIHNGKNNKIDLSENKINDSVCIDSDGGINYYEYGLIKNTNPIYDGYLDSCGGPKNSFPSGILNEAYYALDGRSDHVQYVCPQGCYGTVCINVSDPYCRQNIDGSITYNTQYGEKSQSDFCHLDNNLWDYSCSGLVPIESLINCPNGCENNKCVD